MDPTIQVPDYEHYNDEPRGSLSPVGILPDSWGPVSSMNLNNYCTTIVTLTSRLPFIFGWLVGDAEWAMGVVRGAHGCEWGNFFHRSGALIEGAPGRLMAAYLTCRGIPLPRSLAPLAWHAQQPHVSQLGNLESPLMYTLLLEPLLRAQGHRLRLLGEAKRGLIQAYIDDLLVVAHALQHFVEGVEAVAAYLGMMGMELNPRKCAMATTERVRGLQLRLCPVLEIPWHWVPAADSVPYLGLQLQSDGEFSLQRKLRTRPAAVHHWCLNTLAPPKVVQDVILAILGEVTQYVTPFIADDSNTARHLDHTTVRVVKDRARYAFDASRDSLQDDQTLGLKRVPTRWQQAAVALVGPFVRHRSVSVRAEVTRMFWEIASAHSICPEVHYPVPEFATLAGGN